MLFAGFWLVCLPLQVLLQTSALSADDESAPAAKVSASGSNRVKLRNGVASFRGVKLAADTPGPYLLRVEPLSRKVNVRQGTLLVQVRAQDVHACWPGIVAGGVPRCVRCVAVLCQSVGMSFAKASRHGHMD